ncbi:MAG: hypothetical protein ACM3O3_05610 [Syntrophothermus sp.]
MSNTIHKIYISSFFFIGILVTILVGAKGFNYYISPEEERVYSQESSNEGVPVFNEEHNLLKPSGPYGHGYGIIGSTMMIVGVGIYMVRKRVRKLFNWGILKYWLEFHIFLCTLGPILVFYHTAMKFGGLVAVSFWSMVAVVLSGIIGRFIYIQIPRTIQGKELDKKEIDEISDNINFELRNKYHLDEGILIKLDEFSDRERYKHIHLSTIFLFLFKDFFKVRKSLKNFKKDLLLKTNSKIEKKEAYKAAKQKLLFSRRIGILRLMQKMFKYWHIVHLPFAIAMFVIMIIHIVVALTFGYKWIF